MYFRVKNILKKTITILSNTLVSIFYNCMLSLGKKKKSQKTQIINKKKLWAHEKKKLRRLGWREVWAPEPIFIFILLYIVARFFFKIK